MKLITLKEASGKLGVTPACFRKWHKAGIIEIIKLGPPNKDKLGRDRRICRVRESDIDKLMETT